MTRASTAPQPDATPAPAMATPEQCRAIWHQARASKWKSATALLTSLGVVMPDDAQEPLSDEAAGGWASWLTAGQAKDALVKLSAAAQEAGREPPPKG